MLAQVEQAVRKVRVVLGVELAQPPPMGPRLRPDHRQSDRRLTPIRGRYVGAGACAIARDSRGAQGDHRWTVPAWVGTMCPRGQRPDHSKAPASGAFPTTRGLRSKSWVISGMGTPASMAGCDSLFSRR